MLKYIKQLNKVITILVVIIVVAISTTYTNNANAGVSDWFYNKNNKSNDKLTFINSLSSYIGSSNWVTANNQSTNTELTMIQNSTLVSINSPKSIKINAATKNTTVTSREMIVPATAYSSTPDQTDSSPFITAWNTTVRDGIVAANFLPFGTKIKIPDMYGDKIFIVEDRMNRRYWHKIDIWFPDRQSALEFGLRTIKIQILES